MLRLVQKYRHIVKGLSSAQVELNDVHDFFVNECCHLLLLLLILCYVNVFILSFYVSVYVE